MNSFLLTFNCLIEGPVLMKRSNAGVFFNFDETYEDLVERHAKLPKSKYFEDIAKENAQNKEAVIKKMNESRKRRKEILSNKYRFGHFYKK
jgi:hypothetical protein